MCHSVHKPDPIIGYSIAKACHFPSYEVGLADAGPEPVPHFASGINLARCLDDDRDGQVNVVRVDETNCNACEARKGCMYCIVGKDLAVDAVIAGAGYRPGAAGDTNVRTLHHT